MSARPLKFGLGRFARHGQEPFLGAVVEALVFPIAEIDQAKLLGPEPSLFSLVQDWSRSFDVLCELIARAEATQAGVPLSQVKACSPLPEARQIFCTGANYRKHVVEMAVALGAGPGMEQMSADERRQMAEKYVEWQVAEGMPYVFLKAVSSISGPNDDLPLPHFSSRADWELELAVVLGASAYRIPRSEAMDHVAGYMIANDITARDKVKRNDPGVMGADWLAAKCAPGFLPLGPLFVPREFIADPHRLKMKLAVNGAFMQDDCTSDMTFDIPRQIEFISNYTRMLPGDILCTGSPAGNGVARGLFLKTGDLIEAEIEGLGKQRNRCVGGS
jgi:2,4-diketo-3-deoxy-L-fuconate hydrolase